MAHEKKGHPKTAAAAGIMAAAAVAAAGAYWLYGAEDAAKHRKIARGWMLKARAEVLDAVEKLQNIDKKQYLTIVDDVVKNYSKAAKGGMDSAEVKRLVKDLRGAWAHISADMTKKAGAKKGAAKKTAKKAAKKGSK